MIYCHHCGNLVKTDGQVGRSDECPHCHSDLHVCYNCQHYDVSVYNECRETQAERVLEKDKANFCDYFAPSEKPMKKASIVKDDAKTKLDALFKKKNEE